MIILLVAGFPWEWQKHITLADPVLSDGDGGGSDGHMDKGPLLCRHSEVHPVHCLIDNVHPWHKDYTCQTMSIPDTKIIPVRQCPSLTQRLHLLVNANPWHKDYTCQTMSIPDTKVTHDRQCPSLIQRLCLSDNVHPQHKDYIPNTKVTPVRHCPPLTQKLHLSDNVHPQHKNYTCQTLSTLTQEITPDTTVRQHPSLTHKAQLSDNINSWLIKHLCFTHALTMFNCDTNKNILDSIIPDSKNTTATQRSTFLLALSSTSSPSTHWKCSPQNASSKWTDSLQVWALWIIYISGTSCMPTEIYWKWFRSLLMHVLSCCK